MPWNQSYDPFGSILLSALVAAIPVATMLIALAFLKIQAHWAAISALVVAFVVAVFVFGMPVGIAGRATLLGIMSGLFPIGWIVLNIIFLYRLTVANGSFEILQRSIGGITEDRRLQLLLIAFAFGAFFEGAAGFGTPVAVTAALLIGLGFSPLAASGLSLIANTAPVAFGALGTPVIALAGVTGLDVYTLSAMIGRQLPFFSLLVPFWLIWAFAGWRGMLEVWPAILVTGVSFAVPQFLVANYHGPYLVDVIAALVSMGCLIGFMRVWRPRRIWKDPSLRGRDDSVAAGEGLRGAAMARTGHGAEMVDAPPVARMSGGGAAVADQGALLRAWMPWLILTVFVFLWGLEGTRGLLNGIWSASLPIEGLHRMVVKVPPVVAAPVPEGAVFAFGVLSMTGTGILAAAVLGGLLMGFSPLALIREYGATIWRVRYSLITIAAMLGLGYLTRYSGLDATMGLAFANTGMLYPLFGTLLGWLGVALTGSDTASNVLFGGLQRITAEQLGLSPVLMASANSSGGVMGKMIDAQSIVVASTATNWFGHEGDILRYVFFHSIALAVLVGLLVTLQAYVPPFTGMVLH
ncbi:L-lactate permease [Roseomonas mucosa]|uniref:L-lactate permease n=1 Tax=Roseomonas mucosa TaxID=207340 RepID=A0A1S8DCU2_9PROT|nr:MULTISPECIES: L-lactate permease [Roseomonas]MBS5901853.1 L-lactate permease [Acetobacteraceae bacterium]ATR20968.1 L-lactate permease [Roseomonas sp. FDAARGOS_362]MCG7352202.1 L-lactate permease [Roseomonas mucosa]MCG7356651.1 L-lactate permease [Roseomonas mucosa]MDT8289682.1 L-lactate permease [Roseomonas mucosa]